MINIKITENDVLLAEQYRDDMGRLNNSITCGNGSVSGFLGEIITANLLGVKNSNTYDYDLITRYGKKVDVKTKRTTVVPKITYDCSVADFNTKQQCDIYVFVRIRSDLSEGWVLGYKYKQTYFDSSVFMKEGQIDHSNGFIVRADCYNLPIHKLDNIEELM